MITRGASIFALILILAFVGCSTTPQNPATPAAPTPPAVQVAQSVNALAQALDVAVTALQAARSNGKISPADVANAEKVAAAIAITGKAINAELRTSDDWATQRKVILNLVVQAGLQNAMANLPPPAAAILAASAAAFNQISSSVGGPQI